MDSGLNLSWAKFSSKDGHPQKGGFLLGFWVQDWFGGSEKAWLGHKIFTLSFFHCINSRKVDNAFISETCIGQNCRKSHLSTVNEEPQQLPWLSLCFSCDY